jgi:hypothetical protein
MNAIIAESAGVAINPAIIETIDAVTTATIGMTEAEGANAKDIAKLLKLDRSATWRRLTGACTDGYVCNLEQRRGMRENIARRGRRPSRSQSCHPRRSWPKNTIHRAASLTSQNPRNRATGKD